MKNDIVKLIVHDSGDTSVGISPTTWEIHSPFFNHEDETKEDLDWFRNEVLKLYNNYAEGKQTALYDFEIEKMRPNY